MLNRPHPVFLILNLSIAALSVAVLIFATYSADAFAQSGPGGVDKEGSWYVGENLRVGDYFSYDLCYMGYKECTEFNMRIWFKEEVLTKDGTQWLADVVVTDDDRVVVGTMAPGGPVLWPYGASHELRVYGWAFESSVLFLSNFISFGSDSEEEKGKKFTDVWIFRIGELCGFQLAPSNLDVVTVPAGTWEDAVVVSWSGCGNGKTWIADEFPLPLKADAYALTRDGHSLEFAFTLVDYGNMQESPFIGIISTSEKGRAACEARSGGIVPVRGVTDGSKYEIFASYGPEHPKEWCRIELSIEFVGQDGLLLEQVQFDIVVLDDDVDITRSIAYELGSRTLYAQSGTYHLEFDVRERPGIAEYAIVVYGSAPDWAVPDQSERDVLAFPVEVRPNAGTEMSRSDENALANEAGHTRAPLAQVRDGIQAGIPLCPDGHAQMASPSGVPVCVFEKSVLKLEYRGFEHTGEPFDMFPVKPASTSGTTITKLTGTTTISMSDLPEIGETAIVEVTYTNHLGNITATEFAENQEILTVGWTVGYGFEVANDYGNTPEKISNLIGVPVFIFREPVHLSYNESKTYRVEVRAVEEGKGHVGGAGYADSSKGISLYLDDNETLPLQEHRKKYPEQHLRAPAPPEPFPREQVEYEPPPRELLEGFFGAYFAGSERDDYTVSEAMDFVLLLGEHLNYTLPDLKGILGAAGYTDEEIEAEWSGRASTQPPP